MSFHGCHIEDPTVRTSCFGLYVTSPSRRERKWPSLPASVSPLGRPVQPLRHPVPPWGDRVCLDGDHGPVDHNVYITVVYFLMWMFLLQVVTMHLQDTMLDVAGVVFPREDRSLGVLFDLLLSVGKVSF